MGTEVKVRPAPVFVGRADVEDEGSLELEAAVELVMAADEDFERSFLQLDAKDFAADELVGLAERGSGSSVGDLNTLADDEMPTSLPRRLVKTTRTCSRIVSKDWSSCQTAFASKWST